MPQANEQSAFEREMAKKNNSVVYILNITDEVFTHPYGGIPYTLNAREKMPFPYPVGMHLAKHLAMKLARADAKAKGKLSGNDDKKSGSLYSGAALEPFLSKIIISEVEQSVPAVKSENEILQEKTKEMQEGFRDNAPPKPEVTKNDVVKALKDRNVKFNPRASKEELLELLVQAEAKGE